MGTCRRCGRPLRICAACDGGRKKGFGNTLTCSTCKNTGQVCLEHGGGWK
ncbi:DnaJ-class molecular chaperone [Thermobifida halotolerans]